MTTENTDTSKTIINDDWLIRPCKSYYDEYKDCKSIKARFNQYFIFGEYVDCTQWKKDHTNCEKWYSKNDETAKLSVIQSEYARRKERLTAHYKNDIWQRRDEPPADWNKPLPEWIVERNKNTYLDLKNRQLQGEKVTIVDEGLCNIL